jgi:snurportin-1
VIAARGATTARLRSGALFERFSSALPGGAQGQPGGGGDDSYSILDCVYHEPDQTYYALGEACQEYHLALLEEGFLRFECLMSR